MSPDISNGDLDVCVHVFACVLMCVCVDACGCLCVNDWGEMKEELETYTHLLSAHTLAFYTHAQCTGCQKTRVHGYARGVYRS